MEHPGTQHTMMIKMYKKCENSFFHQKMFLSVFCSVTRLGDFNTLCNISKPGVTIILPKSPTHFRHFCKSVKILHFTRAIHFGAAFIDIWRLFTGHTGLCCWMKSRLVIRPFKVPQDLNTADWHTSYIVDDPSRWMLVNVERYVWSEWWGDVKGKIGTRRKRSEGIIGRKFFKWAKPGLFLFYLRSFHHTKTNIAQIWLY